jgi:uncharacterized protein (DUF2237 family)
MTAAFLDFSKSRGNDLSTPVPELGFPGLKPGDRWCLCAPRWQEAFEANQASRVVLRATHEAALSYCSLADLKRTGALRVEYPAETKTDDQVPHDRRGLLGASR